MSRRQPVIIPVQNGRFLVVMLFLGLCVTALFARAIDLQVLRKDFYQHQGDVRQVRTMEIAASRGKILDRNGVPLAISTPVDSIWVNPQELLKAADRLPELARILAVDVEELSQRIARRSEREFVYVKRHASPALAEQVMAIELPGVHLEREYRRFYPAGEVTAHLLGITNIDDRGQEGLELAFDDWLQGTRGSKRVIQDRYKRVIENIEQIAEASPGKDLVTSIDSRIQYLAYRELRDAVQEFQAISASAVVLDVPTGEVLAIVNQPSYNPNQRQKDYQRMRNRAVTDFFEPGSVMKPFTIAAALESDAFTVQTQVSTSPGYFQLGEYKISDFRDFGTLDLTGILTKSSNVGVSKVALELESRHMWSLLNRMGFGQVTGSGFPGETPGLLPDSSRWNDVEKSAISRGYGLTTTPLQLAQAYSVIAGAGKMRAPTFVKGAVNPAHSVIDPQLASQLQWMLQQVTAADGTGHRAAIKYYRVAGKTGTSRKATDGGYESRYMATFAGMAPSDMPRLVIVVSINDPASDVYYGGQLAAPVFSRIMAGTLRLLDIPPDDLGMDARTVASGQMP